MRKHQHALVVSAFPATGKTTLFNKLKDKYDVLDSDSSTFDKEHFPENYIEHIKNNLDTADLILVSSHKDVREAMTKAGIDYDYILPHPSLKEEYIGRCWLRGNDENFIKLIDKFWDEWTDVSGIDNYYIQMKRGQYLSDVVKVS